MIDIVSLLFILILAVIIAFLIFERESLAKIHKAEIDRLLEENSRLVKAIIAKNANEYVMTTSIDKVPKAEKEEEQVSSDEIPEESLSDDDFFQAIGKTLEKDKKK